MHAQMRSFAAADDVRVEEIRWFHLQMVYFTRPYRNLNDNMTQNDK